MTINKTDLDHFTKKKFEVLEKLDEGMKGVENIGDELEIDHSCVSRRICRLEKHGWVIIHRKKRPKKNEYHITERGKKILEIVHNNT